MALRVNLHRPDLGTVKLPVQGSVVVKSTVEGYLENISQNADIRHRDRLKSEWAIDYTISASWGTIQCHFPSLALFRVHFRTFIRVTF